MNIDAQQPPLMGFHWNEAEADSLLNRGLLTIIANDLNDKPQVIGTAFVISRDDRKAVCISAAHVFSEVQRIQSPPPRHSQSALAEFLPPRKPIDLDGRKVRAISVEGNRIEAAIIEGLGFNEATDIAIFSISLQDHTSETFFSHEFLLDDKYTSVGGLVCILSYGDQGITDHQHNGEQSYSFKLKRRPVLRVGRVLAYYPEGHRLCRGPCIETSIPVYSGMSGGPVIHYAENGPMKPFGLVCSDPDLDCEIKQDRSVEGRSIIALLPCEVTLGDCGKQIAKLALSFNEVAGIFLPPSMPKDARVIR